MNNQSVQKKKRWLERLQNTRQYYFFQRVSDKPAGAKVSAKELLGWIWDDITYLIKWNINLFLQLRAYGSVIKKYSGLSYFQQWKRMAYVVFKVRTDSINLRVYRLYEEEYWDKVHTYSFNRHTLVQNEFMGYPYKDDITLFRDKLKYYKFCRAHNIKTPEVYSVFEFGKIAYSNTPCDPLPRKNLFVKELNGSSGRGAKKLTYFEGLFIDRAGNVYKLKELEEYLKRITKNGRGLIVQEALENHTEWKKFTNGSLATCRLVTGRSPHNEGEIIPFFAAFRMPFGDSDADNYSVGGMATPVDVESGKMGYAVTPTPFNGSFSFDKLPGTHQQIKGEIVYRWDELVEIAKATHKYFKCLSVGWDISLTTDGFYVVEGNSFWMSGSIEGTSGVPLYETEYPEWVEDWIEIRSNGKIESIPYFMR